VLGYQHELSRPTGLKVFTPWGLVPLPSGYATIFPEALDRATTRLGASVALHGERNLRNIIPVEEV